MAVVNKNVRLLLANEVHELEAGLKDTQIRQDLLDILRQIEGLLVEDAKVSKGVKS